MQLKSFKTEKIQKCHIKTFIEISIKYINKLTIN